MEGKKTKNELSFSKKNQIQKMTPVLQETEKNFELFNIVSIPVTLQRNNFLIIYKKEQKFDDLSQVRQIVRIRYRMRIQENLSRKRDRWHAIANENRYLFFRTTYYFRDILFKDLYGLYGMIDILKINSWHRV